MNNRYVFTLVAFTAAASLLAGCNSSRSAQSLIPGTSSFGNYLWHSRFSEDSGVAFPKCSAKSYYPPGKFTILMAAGMFDGSSFTDSGLSLWGTVAVSRGFSEPPKTVPNLHVRYVLYYGHYKLSTGQEGCFYLGKIVYKGISFDGAALGWPKVYNYGKVMQYAQGPLQISIKGISAKSGSGTLTLKAVTGKTVSTGSVSITGSKIIQ